MENQDCTYEQAMDSISLFIEQFKSNNEMRFVGDLITLEYNSSYSLNLHLVMPDGKAMSMEWGLSDDYSIPYGIRAAAKRDGSVVVAKHKW